MPKVLMLPCPGCGAKNLRVFHWSDSVVYGECLHENCRMSGPLGANQDEAVKKWNDLPRKSSPDER